MNHIRPPGQSQEDTEGKSVAEEISFILYWRNGTHKILRGCSSIEEGFTQAGYGAGALAALDFYDYGHTLKYKWDPVIHEWVKLGD